MLPSDQARPGYSSTVAGHYFDALSSTGNIAHDIASFLLAAGKRGTLAHTRAVVGQARLLAARYCPHIAADMKRAATAAWCHDLAAVVPRGELLAEAEAWKVPLTRPDRAIVALVHGPLAAEVARQKLAIEDEDILNAIRYHSTCRAGASVLEKVVLVADKMALDPTSPRGDFLPDLKVMLNVGLDAAALVYLEWVLKNGPAMGWTIHRHVRAAHAELRDQLSASSGQLSAFCGSA
jgi:predicted HD superfamily hydrolase involved in NAD metabolism